MKEVVILVTALLTITLTQGQHHGHRTRHQGYRDRCEWSTFCFVCIRVHVVQIADIQDATRACMRFSRNMRDCTVNFFSFRRDLKMLT